MLLTTHRVLGGGHVVILKGHTPLKERKAAEVVRQQFNCGEKDADGRLNERQQGRHLAGGVPWIHFHKVFVAT